MDKNAVSALYKAARQRKMQTRSIKLNAWSNDSYLMNEWIHSSTKTSNPILHLFSPYSSHTTLNKRKTPAAQALPRTQITHFPAKFPTSQNLVTYYYYYYLRRVWCRARVLCVTTFPRAREIISPRRMKAHKRGRGGARGEWQKGTGSWRKKTRAQQRMHARFPLRARVHVCAERATAVARARRVIWHSALSPRCSPPRRPYAAPRATSDIAPRG